MDNMSQNTDIRPGHYQDTCIECRDAMRVMFGDTEYMYFCMMNAFKYIWRHEHKGGFTDLKKAEWYIEEAGEVAMEIDVIPVPDLEGLNRLLRREMKKYAEHEK